MADFYRQCDVQELLKCRKVLFLGDSNVRPLYKDLLCALNHDSLIRVDMLRNPDIESYFGDIAIQQCGKKNSWSFWENRIYEARDYRVEMFCTGRLLMDVIRHFLHRLTEVPSLVPDVVYLSYAPGHWKNRWHLLVRLLNDIKFIIGQRVIIGSGFPTTKDFFGDPIFDEIPYFSVCNKTNEEDNVDVTAKISSLGFVQLNLAFYQQKDVFRGVTSLPGWEAVVVRYSSFLLLTCIAQTCLVKSPGRVDQSVLVKAIASAGEDMDDYRQLLLKLSSSWIDMKSRRPLIDNDKNDPAVLNAQEVLHMLWKLRNPSEETTRRKSKHNVKDKLVSKSCTMDFQCSTIDHPIPTSSYSDVQPLLPNTSANTAVTILADGSSANADKGKQENPPIKSLHPIKSRNPSEDTPGVDLDGGDCDSLEDGEIRESSPEINKSHSFEGMNYQRCQNLFSDIDSSDDEVYGNVEFENISNTSEFQDTPKIVDTSGQNEIEPLSSVQIGVDTTSKDCFEYSDAIVISDEENHSRRRSEDVMTYKPSEMIINLDSDDSCSIHDSCSSAKPPKRTSKCSPRKKKIVTNAPSNLKIRNPTNEGLMLKGIKGDLVPWPLDVAKSKSGHGSPLWKWWRNYIQQHNHSLVLCLGNELEIHARVPSQMGSIGCAVPKIIDDLSMFLECLKNIKFGEDCLMNLESTAPEDQPVVQTEEENTPPVQQQCQTTAKKINFQIPQKGTTKIQLNRGNISVRSFASIRHIQSQYTPSASRNVSNSQPFHFYGYGEQYNHVYSTISPKDHWSPIDSWIPAASTSLDRSVRAESDRFTVDGGAKSKQRLTVPDITMSNISTDSWRTERQSRDKSRSESRSQKRKRRKTVSPHSVKRTSSHRNP